MGDNRRWCATAEEREAAERVASTPLSARAVLQILARSPKIVPDALRLAGSAAYTGMWSSTGLRALLNSQRVLQALPEVARGAAQWAPEEPFVSVLGSYLTGTEEALELGCGSGRISRFAAPSVRHLYCGDVSATMLRDAQKTLSTFSNVSYTRLDGRTLTGLPDAAFDVVYAHAVFYLFDLVHALGLLDEIRRVLRPGGCCVISLRTIDDRESADQALQDARLARRRGLGAGRFRPYTAGQVSAMFDLVGLPVVKTVSSKANDRWGYVVFTGEKVRPYSPDGNGHVARPLQPKHAG